MGEWVLKYWLEVVFVAGLGYVAKVWKTQKALKVGIQVLLRDRLIQAYNYHMERGYVYIYEKDTISTMYNQYHALGKNGVIDDLMEEFCSLPTKRRVDRHENKQEIG